MKKIIITLAALMAAAASVCGQDMRTSYFLEGSTYRHRLNPAFVNESNYINFPFVGLGSLNIGISSNLGMGSLLFPLENGKLGTFMHPSVSPEEFLSKINPNNRIKADIGTDLISFGFLGLSGGFSTIDIGVRSATTMNLPYELFEFIKRGMYSTESAYNIGGINMTTNNYLQLSYGYARYFLNNRLSVGAKVKFLAGIGNAEVSIDNMNIYMSSDEWNIEGQGHMTASMNDLSFKISSDDKGNEYISGVNAQFKSILPAGYGVAFDFGAYYDMSDIVDGLAFSASVTDLGYIDWNNGIHGEMSNSFSFSGFSEPIGNGSSLDDELSRLGEELAAFGHFEDKGTTGRRKSLLSAKMYLAAEYTLPMYRKLKFGVLNTTVFNDPVTWSEIRLSAVFMPSRFFDMTVNYGYSAFGSTLGWMLNLHSNGFNLFVGSEMGLGKMSPQFIPLNNTNMVFTFGMNITWGRKKIAEKLGLEY